MSFGFSPQLDEQLLSGIQAALSRVPQPWYAAFDADGTLWDTDVGEMFFRYQIKNCGLPSLPPDPWAQYEHLKETNYKAACTWLAEINNGQRLADVQQWAKDCFNTHSPLPVFPAQKRLIQYLKSLSVRVVIVTASVKWAVEPAAHIVGLTPEDVLGITTRVENGVVTNKAVEPVTWREGKANGILQFTNGVKPIFCAGNSTGDAMLLDCSHGVSLAVCSKKNSVGELYESEQKFQTLAREKNWLCHIFDPI